MKFIGKLGEQNNLPRLIINKKIVDKIKIISNTF